MGNSRNKVDLLDLRRIQSLSSIVSDYREIAVNTQVLAHKEIS